MNICKQILYKIWWSVTAVLYAQTMNCGQDNSSCLIDKVQQKIERENNDQPEIGKKGLLLESVIGNPDFWKIDIKTQLDLIQQLLDIYTSVQAIEKEEILIKNCLEDPQYRSRWVSLKIRLASLYFSHRKFQETEKLIQELSNDIGAAKDKEREQYSTLRMECDLYYRELLHEAERLFSIKSIDKALDLYLIVMEACQKNVFPFSSNSKQNKQEIEFQLNYRIAESYALIGNWQLAKETLDTKYPIYGVVTSKLRTLYLQRSLLEAAIHFHLKDYATSLSIFRSLIPKLSSSNLHHLEDAYFLAAVAAYQLEHIQEAHCYIDKALSLPSASLSSISHLWRAKILLKEDNPLEALHSLLEATHEINYKSPFFHEMMYLKGIALLRTDRITESIGSFEQALCDNSDLPQHWNCHLSCHLGWAYLKQALTSSDLQKKRNAFILASSYFEHSVSHCKNEEAIAGLAHTYVYQTKELSDSNARNKALSLISDYRSFSHPDKQIEALILQAQCQENPESAAQILEVATSNDQFANSPLRATAYYLKGLFYLSCDKAKIHSFNSAIDAFDAAYQWFKTHQQHDQAAYIQFELAKSLIAQEHDRSIQSGIEILEHLTQIKNKYEILNIKLEDLYYLLSWSYTQLAKLNPCTPRLYIDKSKSYLKLILEKQPQSTLYSEGLHNLAKILFLHGNYKDAKQLCEQAIQHCSDNKEDEILYLLINCHENSSSSLELLKDLRRRLFETYPHSPRAAECYFKFYPLKDYTQLDKEALNHLEKMPEVIPHSPYLICSNFLLGYAQSLAALETNDSAQFVACYNKACFYYKQAQNHRSQWKNSKTSASLHDASFEIAHLRSLVEEGKLLLLSLKHTFDHQVCSRAIDTLRLATRPLEKSLAFTLDQQKLIHLLYYEALHYLASVYIKDNQYDEAKSTLLSLIEQIPSPSQEEQKWLFTALVTLADLERKRGHFSSAFKHLQQAEQVSCKYSVPREAILQVWIEQSLCLKEQGHLENSMVLLSRVINDETPSSLRIKAMFLRAEIYELQQRPELAIRQLEATAKKGGEWGQLAAQKLEFIYGTR